jgi:hypothetical protein
VIEYGDVACVMGGGYGGYSVFQRERIGWLDGSGVPAGLETLAGRAELAPLSEPGLRAPRAVFTTAGGTRYAAEFRRPLGFDAHMYPTTYDGAFVRLDQGDGTNFALLDLTPGTPDQRDAALPPGATFPDAALTVTAMDPDALRVTVGQPPEPSAVPATPPPETPTPAASTTVSPTPRRPGFLFEVRLLRDGRALRRYAERRLPPGTYELQSTVNGVTATQTFTVP